MAKKRARRAEHQPDGLTSGLAVLVRDRVKELRRVKAKELRKNPKNFRHHPAQQREAFRSVVNQIGFCGACLAREENGEVLLIDGHMRADEVHEDAEIPCLILDVTAEEADLLLATHDPIGLMADNDSQQLYELLQGVDTVDGSLHALWSQIIDKADVELEPRAGAAGGEGSAAAEYPLAPMPGEKYDYVVIFCGTDVDTNSLHQLLQIGKVQSYKSSVVGIGRVITFRHFKACWDKRETESRPE